MARVIDVMAGTDLVKVPVGRGSRLLRLFGTRLYAFSPDAVRVIDIDTNAASKDQPLKDVRQIVEYDDGARAVGFTKDEVVWVNVAGAEPSVRRAALPPALRGSWNLTQPPQVVILSAR